MKNYDEKKSSTYRLVKESTDIYRKKIQCSKDINEFVREFYFDDIEIYESFFIVLMNRSNVTEGYVKISQGGTAGTVVDIKLVAKYAIDSLCHSVILCHNHPSGNMQPSNEDKNLTDKIKNALSLFDIKVLDHIILSPYGKKYLSLADEGLIY